MRQFELAKSKGPHAAAAAKLASRATDNDDLSLPALTLHLALPYLSNHANEAASLFVELTAHQVGADASRAAGGDDAGRGEQAGKGK